MPRGTATIPAPPRLISPPFVKLSEKVYAKLESVNPGGSIKDRPVKWIIDHQPHLGSKIVDLSSSFEWDSDCGDVYLYTSKGFNFGDFHWSALWSFQNHSDDHNIDVKISKTYKFISNRDIKEGEELFENYNLSTKEWL